MEDFDYDKVYKMIATNYKTDKEKCLVCLY